MLGQAIDGRVLGVAMDQSRFDALARTFAGNASRRKALAGALGVLLGAGGASIDIASAKHRKRCNPACPIGQKCKRGRCICPGGAPPCGSFCCTSSQTCAGETCVPLRPDCLELGAACSGVGVRCCENLTCGSGQGGEPDVACYIEVGGPCTDTSECTFNSYCQDGVCVHVPVCNVPLGEECTAEDLCCSGGVCFRMPDQVYRCCRQSGQTCDSTEDCCLRNCTNGFCV